MGVTLEDKQTRSEGMTMRFRMNLARYQTQYSCASVLYRISCSHYHHLLLKYVDYVLTDNI